MRHRRVLLAGGAILGVAALAWTGLWFEAARRARQAVESWVEARRSEGYAVEYRALAVSGFPFSVEVRLEAPAVRWPAETPLAWAGERATIDLSPLDMRRLTIRAPGTQRLRALAFEAPLVAAVATLSIEIEDDGLPRSVALELADAELGDEAQGSLARIGRVLLSATRLPTPPEDHRTSTVELTLEVEDVELPAAPAPSLGRRIDRLSVDASVLGTLASGPIPAALEGWRDAGGTIEFHSFTLGWGTVGIEGEATLAFDQAMQPIGAASTRIRDHGRLLDAFVEMGWAEPAKAAIAKITIGLLAKPSTTDGAPVAEVPLTAQDGRLYAGPVALSRIPQLRWQ